MKSSAYFRNCTSGLAHRFQKDDANSRSSERSKVFHGLNPKPYTLSPKHKHYRVYYNSKSKTQEIEMKRKCQNDKLKPS